MKKYRTFFKRLLLGPRADSASYIRYLRNRGMRIGEGTVIFEPESGLIDETRPWMVEIGRDVKIARGAVIMTHGYDWSVLRGAYGEVSGSCGKVTIGDNVFLGAGCVILKGVTIGSNVIVGAGSIVTKDIPPDSVAAGNPARVIMTLEQYRQKRRAAQEREARALVREYRAVYGHEPDAAVLSEFFWLFSDDPNRLPPCWEEKISLERNRELCADRLSRNEKRYESMEDFLRSC